MNKESFLRGVLGQDAHIISPLIGGMMNDSSIVLSNNKKYVLYVSTAQANEMVNRPLEKVHLDLVYSLGITSKNIYFDAEKGIKINEYIDGSSLDKVDEYDIKKVATLIHTLHNSKTLSKEDYNPFLRFKGYEEEAKSFVKEFNEQYLKVRDTLFANKDYLESQKKVLSHNDFQKSNVLKGDDGKYYIIDFEFMGNNDEIYDIAAFGNGNVEEGFNLLKEYSPNPSDDLKKRYYLWRMYISLQWYTVALVKHYRGEGEVHHFNFLNVADHFLNNALTALKGFEKI